MSSLLNQMMKYLRGVHTSAGAVLTICGGTSISKKILTLGNQALTGYGQAWHVTIYYVGIAYYAQKE